MSSKKLTVISISAVSKRKEYDMATYRVYATSYSRMRIDIEADSPEEAYEIYENTDGGDFAECGCGWEYDGMRNMDTKEWCRPYYEERKDNDA